MYKGRIIGLNGGIYKILTQDEKVINAKARGKLRNIKVDKNSAFNFQTNTLSTKLDTKHIKLSPKVGDIVSLDCQEDINYILDVDTRKNELIRPDIANIDQILLIFAAKKPDFSFLLLDLFLTNLEYNNIEPVIIISKMDLLSELELNELKDKMKYYEEIGYKVIFVNSKVHENIDQVIPLLKDKVSVLSGQTGAGKSTLINALIPGFTLQTQEISQALGRGKHTTRETTLYQYFGGLIGDTPGFSKLDLSKMEIEDLTKCFIEFSEYKCRFRGCAHTHNSLGCAVSIAAESGKILKSRYENYIKMYEDMQQMKKRK